MTDLGDVTWEAPGGTTFTHGVIYVDRLIRDWRWLWLRKRTVTEVVEVVEF